MMDRSTRLNVQVTLAQVRRNREQKKDYRVKKIVQEHLKQNAYLCGRVVVVFVGLLMPGRLWMKEVLYMP